MESSEFKKYRKRQLQEMRPYVQGEDMSGVSVSEADRAAGSPKQGDFIARNSNDHSDQWLVSAKFCADNYEEVVDA